MRMRRDPYTGELYDADKWYRGADGLWHNIEAEERYAREQAELARKKFERRNAARKAKGRRSVSWRKFCRGRERYDQFLREDGGMEFGEWLKTQTKSSMRALARRLAT